MNTQGQMLPSTERGNIIKKIIITHNPKNIVEIGTWKGLGSTLCIIESINENSNFISIETNQNFHNIAKENLKEFHNKVSLEYGKIIEIEDVFEFISNISLTDEQQQWLNEDIINFKNCPNILHKIPEVIDFLLLDGGEFSTYKEWIKLKDRTKIIALDDINVLKCERIYYELKNDSNYSIIDHTQEGNGFCVFIKN
jgi:hypothetical protein